jgi:inner membrane protein
VAWWLWLAVGLGLLVVELVTPSGFYLMFFGLGAATVGLLTALGLTGDARSQWLVFTLVSVLYVLLFRGRLLHRNRPQARDLDPLVGELAVPQERIPPNGVGRVELRGTIWSARNDTAAPIEPGQRCRVMRMDGLLVFVQPE